MESKPGYRLQPEEKLRLVMVNYFMSRRDALCKELGEIERQLEALGNPVKKPKVLIDK